MRIADASTIDIPGIREVIQALYLETDIAPPTPGHPVAPLGPLMDRLPLRPEEMPELTSRKVLLELMQRRALEGAEQFGEATDDPLAGFFFACGNYAWIFVRSRDEDGKSQPVARKRFSATHELGHFLLHFRPQLAGVVAIIEREELPNWRDDFTAEEVTAAEEGKVGAVKKAQQTFLRQEREANTFAAELLMPEAVVRALAERFQKQVQNKDLVRRLAETLLVSRQAMDIRVQALDLGG